MDTLIKNHVDLHQKTLRGELALTLAEVRGFSKTADLLRKENLIKIEEKKVKEVVPDPPLTVAFREKKFF